MEPSIYKLNSKPQVSTTESSLALFPFEIVHYRSKSVNPCARRDYLPAFPPSPKVVTAAQLGFPCKNLVGMPGMSNLAIVFHFFLFPFCFSFFQIACLFDMAGASDNGQGSSKRTRKKSFVWEHFTVESIGGGCRRACCKRCNQSFAYSSGSKFAGTSHLKRHIALGTCPKNRLQEKKQKRTYTTATKNEGSETEKPKKRYRGTPVPSLTDVFDQESSCLDITKMIILHEYRLHMIEDSAFITFVQNLQPQFKMLTFSDIESECFTIYNKEKQNLMQILGTISGRISLSLDPWTSSQTLRYMCVTGQFIDNDWKLHRRILNFMLVSSHIGNALTDSDGLGAVHDIIYKVRESIKYVKSLPEGSFAEVAQQLQIESTKSLFLDVPVQWNTTYLMLLAAVEFKQAFSYLETCDPNYMQAPSVDEWHKVETLCKYLKLLYEAAIVFMGTCPTANLYFHEAWKIKLELTQAAMIEDTRAIVGKMHERYEQYWKDCSLILAIAVIMDPRFKMKLVEYSFSKIYGEDARAHVKVVNDGIHDLYLEYDSQPSSLTLVYEDQEKVDSVMEGTIISNDDGLQDFDAFVSEMSTSQQPKSELVQYLEESLVPRIQEFDILDWWKLNNLKYPTLSRMARDVLAIPMSTVSSEFMFSTGSRVLDDYRSSLRPETLQALICAKDWLQQEQQPLQVLPDLSKAIVKKEL
ncbi:hypothetical protein MRB53_013896 [Persea americana]|uniref:Uncharacterized protein n=1 Tax=Persea americana TaxID=3435 RepID=A0ACC2K983_PERAE|nr:hypothetical protein MRB53_013896 [Persea americana]